jgi:hypothetical protein
MKREWTEKLKGDRERSRKRRPEMKAKIMLGEHRQKEKRAKTG